MIDNQTELIEQLIADLAIMDERLLKAEEEIKVLKERLLCE